MAKYNSTEAAKARRHQVAAILRAGAADATSKYTDQQIKMIAAVLRSPECYRDAILLRADSNTDSNADSNTDSSSN